MASGRGSMNAEMLKLARRMNHLMDEWMHAGFRGDSDCSWQPAMDVIECEDGFGITVELAGVEAKDLKVEVEGDMIVIYGVRCLAEPPGQKAVYQMELARGPFRRVLKLPYQVSAAELQMEFHSGLLQIRVPAGAARK